MRLNANTSARASNGQRSLRHVVVCNTRVMFVLECGGGAFNQFTIARSNEKQARECQRRGYPFASRLPVTMKSADPLSTFEQAIEAIAGRGIDDERAICAVVLNGVGDGTPIGRRKAAGVLFQDEVAKS